MIFFSLFVNNFLSSLVERLIRGRKRMHNNYSKNLCNNFHFKSELFLIINSYYLMTFFLICFFFSFTDILLHSQIYKSWAQIEAADIDGPTACRHEAPKVNKDRNTEARLRCCERREVEMPVKAVCYQLR